MRKDIEKLINQIQVLAIQISTRTKHDVFLRYYGHVNAINVGIKMNGHNSDSPEEKICDMYMDYLTNTEIKTELKKTKRILEELRRK